MSEHEQSMWDLGSGLPLDGARVKIVSAKFNYNQEYNANAVVLDLEFSPEEGENQHQLYSVGKNYEPADGGATVEHKSGKFVMFNDRSNIGRWIKSYVTARGDGDYDLGLKTVKAEGLEPHKVDCWVGLDITLASESYKDQNEKERSTMVVGEYHGKEGGAKASKTKASDSKSASKAKDEDSDGESFADILGAALFRKLKKAAAEAKDHDAFMDLCFDGDLKADIVTDDKAHNKKVEKIIMDDKPTGLFMSSRDDD